MSILEKLASYDGRVVDFTLSADCRTVKVEECCDNYFSVDLTRNELGQMIAELQALHVQMADSESPPQNYSKTENK